MEEARERSRKGAPQREEGCEARGREWKIDEGVKGEGTGRRHCCRVRKMRKGVSQRDGEENTKEGRGRAREGEGKRAPRMTIRSNFIRTFFCTSPSIP